MNIDDYKNKIKSMDLDEANNYVDSLELNEEETIILLEELVDKKIKDIDNSNIKHVSLFDYIKNHPDEFE